MYVSLACFCVCVCVCNLACFFKNYPYILLTFHDIKQSPILPFLLATYYFYSVLYLLRYYFHFFLYKQQCDQHP